MPVLLRNSDRSRALRVHAAGQPARFFGVVASTAAACVLCAQADAVRADELEGVEEMVVVGDERAPMDVLAGASTTRIDVDQGLLEGARLDDLLAEVPGVQVRRLGGAGGSVELSIRGSSPQQVPVFLDGIRIESGLTSRGDLSTVCLDVLDEIQVTRGAGAARAGSGGIGGLVNLVPRKAQAEPETRVRIGGGHFGTVEGSVRHARMLGPWSVNAAYCGLQTDGDFKFQRERPSSGGGFSPIERRRNNKADRHTTLVRLGRDFESARLELTQLFTHLDRGAPGLETNQRRADERGASLLSVLRLSNPDAVDDESAPSHLWQWKATLAHRFEENRFRDPEGLGGSLFPSKIGTTLQSVTPRLSTTRIHTGFGGEHSFSLLVEGRFDHRASNEAKSKSRWGGSARVEVTSAWFDNRLRISPSLRLERFDGLDAEWIPALFVEMDLTDWLRLKASASRSYRAPSFQELYLPDKGFERGNEDLRPEDAQNVEFGVRISSPFESDWLDGEIEFTYFLAEIDRSIVFQKVSPSTFAFVNLDASTNRGHELTVTWRPHDWIRIVASRTVTEARLDSNDERLPGIAVSQTDGRIELGPRDRFKLVGEVHYTGRLPNNTAGNDFLASRVAYDASAAVDLVPLSFTPTFPTLESLWLTVRGRNLGNVALRDTSGFPRPGRSGSITLEGVF